jgi:aspartate dehydrogenase
MARLFPRSTNVAAAVALAVGAWDVVEAVLLADPAATLTRHEIAATGPAGEYRFEIRNRPSPRTPTTSEIVPYAVLRTLRELARPGFVFR